MSSFMCDMSTEITETARLLELQLKSYEATIRNAKVLRGAAQAKEKRLEKELMVLRAQLTREEATTRKLTKRCSKLGLVDPWTSSRFFDPGSFRVRDPSSSLPYDVYIDPEMDSFDPYLGVIRNHSSSSPLSYSPAFDSETVNSYNYYQPEPYMEFTFGAPTTSSFDAMFPNNPYSGDTLFNTFPSVVTEPYPFSQSQQPETALPQSRDVLGNLAVTNNGVAGQKRRLENTDILREGQPFKKVKFSPDGIQIISPRLGVDENVFSWKDVSWRTEPARA
ncbi:hypothetical protein C8J56DRAFT_1054318 [Mycena floridula]|nr:hypothetical protein C8J56DRAFT_1054318 [Mycena floridula]